MPSPLLCPICNEPSAVVAKDVEGYKAGAFFDIMECGGCHASYSEPMDVDSDIYKDIYKHGRTISGYNRYHAYFREIKQKSSPLDFLASQEECYWFIANRLKQRGLSADTKILEVGSGLGYLTYALHQAGYSVSGVELSSVAVDEATKQFGALYRCQNALDLVADNVRYDCIIFTEVVEHLTQPIEFIENLKSLLAPGGEILVTTPNKSYQGFKEAVWATELPPVHLWWFSKKSFEHIAQQCGLDVTFFSFRDWNRAHFPKSAVKQTSRVISSPVMDSHGVPIHPKEAAIKSKKVSKKVKSFFRYFLNKDQFDVDDANIIGAIFKKA